MNKEIIYTDEAPKPIGPYNQAVKANGMVFTSGQIPLDLETGHIVGNSAEQQTEVVLNYLKAVLNKAGSSLDKVVKTTIYLDDIQDFPHVNTVYAKFFPEATAPARSTVEVANLPRGVLVEIDAVALA